MLDLASNARKNRSGAILTVDLDAVRAKYRLLRTRAGTAACSAVLKSDAYGLGAARVAAALHQEGCRLVATKAAFTVNEKGVAELMRIADGVTARCVNDEETLERRFEIMSDADFWREAGVATGFEKIPLHCYVHLFHLESHQNIWVHVQHMTEYHYQPELRDKLVLPGQADET